MTVSNRSKFIKRGRAALAALMALCMLILCGCGDGSQGSGALDATEQIVPDFIGKNYAEIIADAQYIGLIAFVPKEEVFSDQYEAGAIISQEPAAGTKLQVGGIVYLTVSKGRQGAAGNNDGYFNVESFVGLHYDPSSPDAGFQAALSRQSFGTVTCSYAASDKPYGTVIGQYPNAGTQAANGTALSLTLSDGTQGATKTTVKEGDMYYFGMEFGSGAELAWQVLNVESDKILLLASYGFIDGMEFNDTYTNTTWADSSLRKYLNGYFLEECFSASERARIVTSSLPAYKNPTYEKTPQGKDTNDKVFLLSIQAVKKYLTSNKQRQCSIYEPGNTCDWWLKTMGSDSTSAAYVDYNGVIHEEGIDVTSDQLCVRPAIWVKL